MIKFRYLFHGTSSVHKANILANGLSPLNGELYLTTHPMVAPIEAEHTVKGEGHLTEGYKNGIGGLPLVTVVERSAAINLKLDVRGYYERRDSVPVQREMETIRSPLVSIPPLRGGDFQGIGVYRSDVFL